MPHASHPPFIVRDGYDTDSSYAESITLADIDFEPCQLDNDFHDSKENRGDLDEDDPSTPIARTRPPLSDLPLPHSHPQLQFNLSASIAMLPDFRLRSLVASLASKSPDFEKLIRQEVLAQLPPNVTNRLKSPSLCPGRMRARSCSNSHSKSTDEHKRKVKAPQGTRKRSASSVTMTVATRVEEQPVCIRCGVRGNEDGKKCHFHSGRREEEVYEFLSRSPEGQTFNVVRTITMWSCCDGDAHSIGCEAASQHRYPLTP
ncbi:hypothetical protein BDN72DRAFT_849117 [Pluteus cervinus]|uniref:Uncharacterized protein n=1 Tax=Pluteus cervinus TaxID=181527 RepID=A0ACD3A8M2_9AGAR|nr:hypothetical protein BDN72DRAFT_849117 [Pluteus cervinus]